MLDPLKNFRTISFKGEDHADVDFSGADLRGCDFTGANLSNANLSGCITGLTPVAKVLMFIAALIVSLISGYFAMLTTETLQAMLKSGDPNQEVSAYIAAGLMIVFILLAIWKGGQTTLKFVAFTIVIVLFLGLFAILIGFGTGLGSLYGSIALILFVVMMYIGTIARATAGTLSSTIIYFVVAISGGLASRSLGGGIGTVILAISCAIISRRVLSGKGNYPMRKSIALRGATYFGTSFKDADLTGANFSGAKISNSNFTGAKLTGINWENASKKFNMDLD